MICRHSARRRAGLSEAEASSRPRLMKAGSRSQACRVASDGHCSVAAHRAVPGPLPRSSNVTGRKSGGVREAVAAIAPASWAYAAGSTRAA